MYNITIMDQYSPAIVTVPANMSSVEFSYNATSIVANREYIITVSAISDQGMSCPSDPVVIGKCQVCVCVYFIPIHIFCMCYSKSVCFVELLVECCIYTYVATYNEIFVRIVHKQLLASYI